MTDDLPGDARVGRVALAVADLERVAAFYRDVVGLAELERDGDGALFGAADARGDPRERRAG